MKISFVNNHPYPCGCQAKFSSGGGEYSDCITINLCPLHAPMTNPEEHAEMTGYYRSASGVWVAWNRPGE
jgi:hypothetical protein